MKGALRGSFFYLTHKSFLKKLHRKFFFPIPKKGRTLFDKIIMDFMVYMKQIPQAEF
jgi:hypothetical protein